MDYKGIGSRIRKARLNCGMTQEKLAEIIDVSPTHVSHIETGVTKLSLQVLEAIARTLDVRVDSLLYDKPRGSATIAVEEIAAVLESCNAEQAQIIADLVKAAKLSLDAHMKK